MQFGETVMTLQYETAVVHEFFWMAVLVLLPRGSLHYYFSLAFFKVSKQPTAFILNGTYLEITVIVKEGEKYFN